MHLLKLITLYTMKMRVHKPGVHSMRGLTFICILLLMLDMLSLNGDCHAIRGDAQRTDPEPIATHTAPHDTQRPESGEQLESDTQTLQADAASQETMTHLGMPYQSDAKKTLAEVLRYEGLEDPNTRKTQSRPPQYVRSVYDNIAQLEENMEQGIHMVSADTESETVWFIQHTEVSWLHETMQFKYMMQVDTFHARISRAEIVLPLKHRHGIFRQNHLNLQSRNHVVHMSRLSHSAETPLIKLCSDDQNCVSKENPIPQQISMHNSKFDVYNVTVLLEQWQLPYKDINITEPQALYIDIPWKDRYTPNRDGGPLLVIYATLQESSDDSVISTSLHLFEGQQRLRRSSGREYSQCRKKDWYVDFSLIGWDSWIVEPRGYNASRCTGECDIPFLWSPHLSQISSHALIKNLYHNEILYGGMEEVTHIPEVHCAPVKLEPISILFHSGNSFVKRTLPGMRVGECGCV